MPPSGSGIFSRSIAWALITQMVWVPLVAIDLHDRWVARQRDITPPGRALPPSPLARTTPLSLNDLLGAARPVQQLAGQANQMVSGAVGQAVQGGASGVGLLLSSAGSGASSLLDRPLSVSFDAAAPAAAGATMAPQGTAAPLTAPPANTLLGRAFTRAQLLGGSIGLADLQEGPMAPLALAERALQRVNADPLAPLPSPWREPMRQALGKLPGAPLQLNPARLVYVPSSTVSQPVEVPLALQSDGSVDILEAPASAAVLREIDGWSRQQRRPASGSLQPALVHLHPLPAVAPLTPPVADSRPAAATTAPVQEMTAPVPPQTPAQVSTSAGSLQPPLSSESPQTNAAIPVPIVREAPAAAAQPAAVAEAPAPLASPAP